MLRTTLALLLCLPAAARAAALHIPSLTPSAACPACGRGAFAADAVNPGLPDAYPPPLAAAQAFSAQGAPALAGAQALGAGVEAARAQGDSARAATSLDRFFDAKTAGDAAVAAAPGPWDSFKQRIDAMIQERQAHYEAIYQHLHRNPELSLQEKATGALIAAEMGKLGYEVAANIGGHGVVSVFKNGAGPTVLVRTDMDALPVQEDTGLPYSSQVPGCMHACGHDIHMATFLATAEALTRMKDLWRGTVVMVAQPAEEIVAGADAMINDGLFTRFPKPDYALALHDTDSLLAGDLALVPGTAFAANDSFNVVFKGRGGHGARPSVAIDPFDQMAEFKLKMNTLIAREVDSINGPAVITLGKMSGGTKRNVIPDEVRVEGMIRTMDEPTRAFLKERVQKIAESIAAGARAPAPAIEFLEPVDAVHTDQALFETLLPAFTQIFGPEHLRDIKGTHGSEDFGVFGKRGGFPSLMFRVGAQRTMDPPVGRQHSSKFAPYFGPTWATGLKAMMAALIKLQADLPKK